MKGTVSTLLHILFFLHAPFELLDVGKTVKQTFVAGVALNQNLLRSNSLLCNANSNLGLRTAHLTRPVQKRKLVILTCIQAPSFARTR